jgi:hypothetical protein
MRIGASARPALPAASASNRVCTHHNVAHCETDSKAAAAYNRATSYHDTSAMGQPMTKTEFLQIRVSSDDKTRIKRAAEADHLDQSTWARRAVLKAVEAWEGSGLRKAKRSVDQRES